MFVLLCEDEPTNHLDLDACVWLEEELSKYKRMLVRNCIFYRTLLLFFSFYKYHKFNQLQVIISHSQDFMNGVCTNIIHLEKQMLKPYTGNYDSFVKARSELLENQMKQYNWEQQQIDHMKVR